MKATFKQLLRGDDSSCRFGRSCAADRDDWKIVGLDVGRLTNTIIMHGKLVRMLLGALPWRPDFGLLDTARVKKFSLMFR